MKMGNSNYNDQVFINCPFDHAYLSMFRACTFTVLDAGFIPRCSWEIDNATEFRLGAIVDIIRECRYGIHDISRTELDSQSKLPRFNMPFELGIFYSAKHFGTSPQKRKKCLILETKKYRYQKFISDLAGIDITPHANRQNALIKGVRNWLVTASTRSTIPPAVEIEKRFRIFQRLMRQTCKERNVDYDTMPFLEVVHNMTDWLKINQTSHDPIFKS